MDDRSEKRRIHDRIRDLETAEFRGFLADLWRRQGYTVTVVDGVALATDSNGETVEIHPVDPDADDLEALLETTRAEEVVLATTTAEAKGITPTRPSVRLLSGRDLADLVVALEVTDLLEADVGNVGSPGIAATPTWLVVALPTVGWFCSLLVLSIGPIVSPGYASMFSLAGAIGVFVCWSLLPATVFFDASRVDGLDLEYSPSRLLWSGLTVFGAGLVSSYYLWVRFDRT